MTGLPLDQTEVALDRILGPLSFRQLDLPEALALRCGRGPLHEGVILRHLPPGLRLVMCSGSGEARWP